jgi:23S rRNA pseudouridine1911/1915/1917 synthase
MTQNPQPGLTAKPGEGPRKTRKTLSVCASPVQSVLMTDTDLLSEDHDEFDAAPDFGPVESDPVHLTVHEAADGERLDKMLAGALDGLSRSRLKALIEDGRVSTDGRIVTDAAYRVKPGQNFDVFIPDPVPAVPLPQDIPIAVVYEDEDLLVIDKPAGLVVHPAAGNPDGTLVNALLHHCGPRLSGIGGVRRPGIVHRLDKDTSGLMVVAKNDLAHTGLAAQFENRTLSRTYHALVTGVPSPSAGEITGNIGRNPTDRKKMAVVRTGGKPALTRYRVLRAFGQAAALTECKLATGRTHQIRVHMAQIGHALVGDPLYGRNRTGSAKLRAVPEPVRKSLVFFPRQALHAVAIEFIHPRSMEIMRFSSEMPLDIRGLIGSLESI